MKRTNISKEDTKRTSTKFENNYEEGLLGKVGLMESLTFVVFEAHYPNMDNSHLYIILLVLFFYNYTPQFYLRSLKSWRENIHT